MTVIILGLVAFDFVLESFEHHLEHEKKRFHQRLLGKVWRYWEGEGGEGGRSQNDAGGRRARRREVARCSNFVYGWQEGQGGGREFIVSSDIWDY